MSLLYLNLSVKFSKSPKNANSFVKIVMLKAARIAKLSYNLIRVIQGASCMSLFSWFIRPTRVKSPKNNKMSLEQELTTFNNNTMWPIAKVRKNTVVQQQEYISSATHLKHYKDTTTFKEHTSTPFEQH